MTAPLSDPWLEPLRELCGQVRDAARTALVSRTARELGEPVRRGVGDVTFGLDEITERVVDDWFERAAERAPLSLLTEDRGWRHRGPSGTLGGFDHGGPRIALDPVDGTRNLMADLRSAWTVVSVAGPGPVEPRLADVSMGIVAELPVTTAGRYRVIRAAAEDPTRLELRELASDELLEERELRVDDDDRPDRGYFPFFRYDQHQRPDLAAIEATFFERLREHEGADIHHCYDDQWCCAAGQLVALMLGTYRSVVDIRSLIARRQGRDATVVHPYDIAGAVLCARRAGCVVDDAHGEPLDFPIDCEAPLDFVGWVNASTRARLGPHLRAALDR